MKANQFHFNIKKITKLKLHILHLAPQLNHFSHWISLNAFFSIFLLFCFSFIRKTAANQFNRSWDKNPLWHYVSVFVVVCCHFLIHFYFSLSANNISVCFIIIFFSVRLKKWKPLLIFCFVFRFHSIRRNMQTLSFLLSKCDKKQVFFFYYLVIFFAINLCSIKDNKCVIDKNNNV